MGNKLIENKTDVYWTVQVNEGLYVRKYEIYNGKVEGVTLTNRELDVERFNNQSSAERVAVYSKGKILKHSRTTVITEIVEEVKVEVN